MDLLQWDWVKKTVDGIEKHWLFDKENVPGMAVSK